jgi:hypothetical protein
MVVGGTERTVTAKEHWRVPQAFETVHVTVVTPSGKQVPEAGEQPVRTPFTTVGRG